MLWASSIMSLSRKKKNFTIHQPRMSSEPIRKTWRYSGLQLCHTMCVWIGNHVRSRIPSFSFTPIVALPACRVANWARFSWPPMSFLQSLSLTQSHTHTKWRAIPWQVLWTRKWKSHIQKTRDMRIVSIEEGKSNHRLRNSFLVDTYAFVHWLTLVSLCRAVNFSK